MTPWGRPTMYYKTRKKKNKTDKYIVKRRIQKYQAGGGRVIIG